MKTFLVLSISIVFVTVSCAGPNEAGWTKRDFRSDEFEKDRQECIQTLNNNLHLYSQTSGVVDDCLAMKGYQYQPQSESPLDKENPKTAEVAKTAGKVLLGTVLAAVAVAALAAYVVLSVLAGGI